MLKTLQDFMGQASSVIGSIGAITGDVAIIRANGERLSANQGDQVFFNDSVVTGDQSAALLQADNSGLITLGQLAQVNFTPSLAFQIQQQRDDVSEQKKEGNLSFKELEEAIANGESVEDLVNPSSLIITVATENAVVESTPTLESLNALSSEGLLLVWERFADEIIPVSGYRVPSEFGAQDFFGNQIGNLQFESAPSFEVSNNQQETQSRDLQATDDTLTVTEDSVGNNGNVSNNDFAISGSSLSFALAQGQQPQHGSLIFNNDGSYEYTPNTNFHGKDSFQYVVSNTATGESQIQTVTITVNSVNDLPVANADSYTTNEDIALTTSLLNRLTINDSDLDANTLTVNTTPISNVSNGTLSLNSNGTFTYTPNAHFHGTDSFTYEVSDGNGGTAQATVTMTVNAVNDAPTVTNDSYSTDEDTGLTATLVNSVLVNDSDADGDGITVNTTPISNVSNGTLTLNSNGTFTYTPNANFNGVDSFVYEVSDGQGGVSQATATITVNSVNDAPVANDDSYTTNEDTVLSTSLLNHLTINDTDLDTDTLTVNTTPVSDVSNGSLTLNSNGTFTYTPNANFHGTDSFTYDISDGNGGTAQAIATITVNSVNDNPIAVSDGYSTDEDTGLTATLVNGVLVNDSDADGDGITVNTTPISNVSNGTLSLNSDGTFTYTPNANFHGTDSFTYEVSDGNGGTAQATATITVNSIADLSTSPESETINEDTALVSTVSTGDSTTSGGALSYALVTGPSNGTFTVAIDPSTGNYTYTPNADFAGSDSFQYLVTDASSGESAIETVSITVNPVADLSGTDDVLTVPNDTLTAGDVSTNDSTTSHGGNGNLAYSKLTDPDHGALVFNGDGTYTYNPTGIGLAGGSDSFTYVVTDAASGESSVQTVNITIEAGNFPPSGSDNSATIDEDAAYALEVADFGFSDPDGDTFTGVRIDSLPALGTLTLLGVAVTIGQIVTVASITGGELVFTPAADGNGSPYSSFTFSVQDSAGSIDTSPNTFTLNVTPINDAPVASDDSYEVITNTPFAATEVNGVLANDSDADGVETLSVDTTPVSDVSNGILSLSADGTFTYTPNADFHGTDSFVYEISDGVTTSQATATITVDYVSNTIIGTGGKDNLVGAAASDDDIYSGGVGDDGAENVQGVGGTIGEAQVGHVGSGNDRLIFDADDTYVASASNGNGHIRIRDFTVGDVTTDSDADTLVLGDFLRAGDPSFDGSAEEAVKFFHFVNDKLVYIDRDGALGASGDAARDLVSGDYNGIAGGASLLLEFKGLAFDATPGGEILNTEAQIQALMDVGFLDFS